MSTFFYRSLSLVLALTLLVVMGPISSGSVAAASNTWYVNANANGANNGSSWTNAFTNLQLAIAAATATDQIWVAKGIYRPTGTTDRTVSFTLKKNVALYGGFAGGETALSQRNWQTNLTILSGDMAGDDMVDVNGIVTDAANIEGDNSYHVVRGNGLNAATILDGFIITGGNAKGSMIQGGGMYNNNSSSPTLRNISFFGNYAQELGGGLYNTEESHPSLTNVLFSGNSVAFYGGGMYSTETSNPTLTNVHFRNNSAGESGGGLSITWHSNPILTNVSFSGNSAQWGGGMHNYYYSNPTLTNVSFSGNHAVYLGGGLDNEYSSGILTNVSFSGNDAGSRGGAIYNIGSSPTLTNVSFNGNNAESQGGAIYNNSNSFPTLRNSILWGNSSSIVNDDTSAPTVSYSLVEGCFPAGVWNVICGINGGQNLADADPLFVSPIDSATAPNLAGNLHLQAGSPAIDAGNNAFNTTTTDLADLPRIYGSIIDLGPYEYGYVKLYLPTAVR